MASFFIYRSVVYMGGRVDGMGVIWEHRKGLYARGDGSGYVI